MAIVGSGSPEPTLSAGQPVAEGIPPAGAIPRMPRTPLGVPTNGDPTRRQKVVALRAKPDSAQDVLRRRATETGAFGARGPEPMIGPRCQPGATNPTRMPVQAQWHTGCNDAFAVTWKPTRCSCSD
jgi:hypothetical protein